MKITETTDRLLQAHDALHKLEGALESRFGSGLVVSISSYKTRGELADDEEDLGRVDVPAVCIHAEDAEHVLRELRVAVEAALARREEHLERQLRDIRKVPRTPKTM